MSYREADLTSHSGPLKNISWILFFIAVALLMLLAWHQIEMNSVSRRYGIEVRSLSQVLWFLGFLGVECGAAYAALRRQYGLSIGLSGFVISLHGIAVLFALAAM
jgi:hypothetical protein